LVLALPRIGNGGWQHAAGRAAYNAGRVFTYGLLGLGFGLAGRTLALAGIQRWVSLTLGVILLVGVLAARQDWLRLPSSRIASWLKPAMGRLLRQRGLGALALLGALNGLLPCGLVYVACLGAAATGEVLRAVEYMLVFGLGTVPLMFGLGLAGAAIPPIFRLKLQRAIPFGLGLVAALLILRGLALGIPYLSPGPAARDGASPTCCH
jgi:hypothetical protein